MNGSLKVLKAHLCDLVKTTFRNGFLELSLENLVEKPLGYSISVCWIDHPLVYFCFHLFPRWIGPILLHFFLFSSLCVGQTFGQQINPLIENAQPPPHIERTEISQILEEPNGNILIRFNSMREQGSCSHFSIPPDPSRYSFAESTSTFQIPPPIHVHHTAPIPEVSKSPPSSPTASQMKGEIDVIHKVINIDFDSLETDIFYSENDEKRNWFFQLDSCYQDKIKQEWISDINRLNTPFDFFCWLEYFLIKQGFEETDFFKISHINVHTCLAKKWKLSDGNTVTQIHPPLQSLRLDTPSGEIIASPFKKGKDTDDSIHMDNIRKIYHQNNYSNQILHTIATQVDSLSSEIKSLPKANIPRFPASYSAPHFQPSTLSKAQETTLICPASSMPTIPSSSLLHKILQTLDTINSNLPSTSKINAIDEANLDALSSSSDTSSLSSSDEFISKIHQVEDSFLDPTEINKILVNRNDGTTIPGTPFSTGLPTGLLADQASYQYSEVQIAGGLKPPKNK
ncbi:hypothetical protein M9H77_23495 [Catharanthus roseus]|uniref:Uncharacterized protein n=1 Tax=Catharanthus roseus TaxID=4058 RepID=A0ACC0AVZ0_CATRO|nr:hypothetical protein M9H77_23495 [Catharanthus roseus]